MIENWKDIPGYESSYQVSDMGRIYSFPKGNAMNHAGKFMKPNINHKGYNYVILRKNGKQKMFFIHRLVGNAFIPNPENLPEINHRFGNKDDNRASELEWNTHDQNMKHASKTGLMKGPQGMKCRSAKLTDQQVLEIRKKYIKGLITYQQLADEYKISTPIITNIINRKIWTHI